MRQDERRPPRPPVRTTRLAAGAARATPRPPRRPGEGSRLRLPRWGAGARKPPPPRRAPAQGARLEAPAGLRGLVARRPLFPWLVGGALALLLAGELFQALQGRPLGFWRDLLLLAAALGATVAAVAAALTSRLPVAS